MFVEALEQLKTEEKESYERGLICDSIDKLIENIPYSFDSYLEILKICYRKKKIKGVLLLFNINQVLVPKEFNVVKYSEFLTKIESNPEIISKDYIQSFYSVLLYFRLNFEKEKVQSLLNKRDLWKYYIPIIFDNYDYYWNKLDYPDDFIIKILNLSYISFDELKRTLFLIKTIKKLLVIVNITIDSISNCCKKNEQTLDIAEFASPGSIINSERDIIIYEIKKILNYQYRNKIIFISFEDDDWNDYIKNNWFLLHYQEEESKDNDKDNKKIKELENRKQIDEMEKKLITNENRREIETENENLRKQIDEMGKKLNDENINKNQLNKKIEELKKLLEDKEQNLKEVKKSLKDLKEGIQTTPGNSSNANEKIIELMEEIKQKENEIKELKSKLPFELSEKEKLMTVIFTSSLFFNMQKYSYI